MNLPSPKASSEDANAINSDTEKQADKSISIIDDKPVSTPEIQNNLEQSAFKEQIAVTQLSEMSSEVQSSAASQFPREVNKEVEDGWQPVQRPRSAGSSGHQLKQQRKNIGKVYNYQKIHDASETVQSKPRLPYSNGRYYVLKKRTVVSGGQADHHYMKVQTPGTKFGRKIYKAVTYRVKSVLSSSNTLTNNSKNVDERLNMQQITISSNGNHGLNNHRNVIGEVCESHNSTIVTLGSSPSYKDVALAPPGTIAKIQVRKAKRDVPLHQELLTCKGTTEAKESVMSENQAEVSAATIETGDIEHGKNLLPDPVILSGKVVKVSEGEEDFAEAGKTVEHTELLNTELVPIKTNLDTCASRDEIKDVILSNDKAPERLPSREFDNCTNASTCGPDCVNIQTSSSGKSKEGCLEETPSSMTETKGIPSPIAYQDDLQNIDTECKTEAEDSMGKLSLNAGDLKDIPNKKLSASAAPFNPSPALMLGPVAVNVSLPPSSPIPTVAPWPLNVTLHPGHAGVMPSPPPMCASPHHPYPSSPRPLNIIHPMPFVYPPYTQPQAMPSSTYAMNMFHPNQYAWQCNINPNTSEFVRGTIWPSCHPVHFSAMPPVTTPISGFMSGPYAQSDSVNCAATPLESNVGEETKQEGDIANPIVIRSVNAESKNEPLDKKESDEKEAIAVQLKTERKLGGNRESGSEKRMSRNSRKYEGEGSLSIFIKGRSHRKQSLRMPISLLSRPYGSQSFKVIYNRVVRGADVTRTSTISSVDDATSNMP